MFVSGLSVFQLGFVGGRCPVTGKEGAACPSRRLSEPDEAQMTFKGCTCTSQCTASITDAYDCDFCYTANGCGRSGIKGHWDYCVYPEKAAYEAQTAAQKMDQQWSQVTADTTHGTYPSLAGILDESIQTSFDNGADVSPAGREKYIHSVGAVCKFHLDIASSSPYTGLLGPGVQEGIIRMGRLILAQA